MEDRSTPIDPTPARARWRRLARLAAIIVGVCLILVIAIVIGLHTPPAKRVILSKVTTLLADQQIDVAVGDLDYNLFDLSIALQDLTIRAPHASDAPPFAQIPRARIDLSLLDLLRGRYVIEEGTIDRPAIHLVVDAAGRDNLPRPPTAEPQPDAEPIDYLIQAFAISNATLRFEDHRQRIDALLPITSIAIEGRSAPQTRHRAQILGGGGRVQFQGRDEPIDTLTGTLAFDNDQLTFEQVRLQAAGADLTLAGQLTGLDESPTADLSLGATVDAARLAAFAGVTERVGGTVQAEVTARGPMATPRVEAELKGSNVFVRDLKDMRVSARGAYEVGTRDAGLERLQVNAPFGRVDAEGAVALAGGASRIDARLQALDLGVIGRALDLPYMAASRVDGYARANWPGLAYVQAHGDARLTLTPTRTRAARGVAPVAGTLDVQARGNRVAVDLRRLRALGVTANGRVSLAGRRTLDGRVVARAGDLGRLVAAVETFLGRPRGALLGTPVSGAAAVEADLGGTISEPSVAAVLQAPDVSLGGVAGIAVAGDVRYTPAAITIDRLGVTWQEASALASGQVGLQGRQPLALTVEARQARIESVLAALNRGDVPASGVVSLGANVAGTVANPTVKIGLQSTELAAYGEALGTMTADARLANRRLDLTELRLVKPQPDGDGILTASGSYHLDRERYTIAIDSEQLHLVSLALPDGTPIRGAVKIDGRGEGTLTDPTGSAQIVVDHLRVRDDEIGLVDVDVSVADREARVRARADKFRVVADARIGTGDPYPAQADIMVDGLDLASLPLGDGVPLTGQLRARATGSADLAEPRAGTGAATIHTLQATWNGQPVAIDGPATIRYAKERVAIDRLVVRALESSVSVNGDLPLDPDGGQGTLHLDARLDLATLARYASDDAGVKADGVAALTGTIQGSLSAIDPNLLLTVENASVTTTALQPGLSNLRARVEIAGGEVRVPALAAQFGPARIDVTARAPFDLLPDDLPVELPRPGGPAQLRADVTSLDLASLPNAPERLGGTISLHAEVEAPRPDLATVTGQITFPELKVQFDRIDLAQEGTSTVAIANGIARVERFSLAGSVGRLDVRGNVGLKGARALDVTAAGNLNIAAISAFTDAARAEGKSVLEIAATGTMSEPRLAGFFELTDATVAVDQPQIAAQQLDVRMDFTRDRASLTRLTGTLNGGTLSGSGFVALGDGGLSDVELRLTTTDVAFDAPLDLRSLSDTDVRITRRDDAFVVDGEVKIQEAGLTSDLNLDTGLLAAMTAPRGLDLTEERSPLLERVRFDVGVTTATPIVVDNNLATAEVTADLRVVGTPYETGMSGRLQLLEGSAITLNERRYEVERGTITFVDDRRISPSFDLRLNTSARNYDIALEVTGPPGDTETALTSSPFLPEPDIMSLLVTGRTLDEMRGEEFAVAREQVLSQLAGRAGSGLGRGLERATGLSTVRVEPNLIASEADPGARLTVGQDLTGDLRLIYSTDLVNSSDQIWVAEYDVTRRFQTRVVRQSDNTYRFDFQHDVRFGGRPEPRRQPRVRQTVGNVTVSGETELGEAEVRRIFDLERGDDFDFFAGREALEDVEKAYREQGFLQSRVSLARTVDGQAVDLALTVSAGPQVELTYEGLAPPSDVQEEIRRRWHRGVFDTQRAGDAIDVLRAWLMEDHYLNPILDSRIQDVGPESRRVTLRGDPGTRFERVDLVFDGARGLEPSELQAIIDGQRLDQQVFTDPEVVTELLERYYREQGYLVAEIDEPRYAYEGTLARVVMDVREGPRFQVGRVTMAGNDVLHTPGLLSEIPLTGGDPYFPAVAERSQVRIRELYWARGYNDVSSDYALALDREAGTVHVAFTLDEGARSVVEEIRVSGNDETSTRLVREQLEIQPQTSLDLAALGRSRRNLYDTGAFALVDIRREDLEASPARAADGDPGTGATTGVAPDQKRVQVNVGVRDVQPFQIQYGAFFDTERGLGGILDVSNHNSLGKARVVGLRSRYDSQLREARLSMSQPSLKHWPFETIGSVYYRAERNPEATGAGAFNVDRRGFSLQQVRTLRNAYVWSYGYRFERARTYDPRLGGLLDETLNVAPLTSTLTRETRDEVLDASRGSFLSHAFSFSPEFLGSDVRFLKYFGQYFKYIPLQPPRRKPFTNEILRPRFVYAGGVRLGLAQGLAGREVPLSERFLSGGSTTLRGFEQNAVGPIGLDWIPLGGEAMLVINNELRFPLFGMFDGVAFVDVGNVFRNVSDFSFSDVRKSGGLGVRVRTPWVLVRVDYGIPFDRRAGEPSSRIYFSIGQAF